MLGGYTPRDRSGWMWDLTIPGGHDFYIDTTAADILVRNCGHLGQFRQDLGLSPGEGNLARLDVGDRSFYGINAHGQPVGLTVNPISATHAETDVFQQAKNAGIDGGEGDLYVDR